eukprot:GHVH01002816.1.p1 GENE.GHVH01002816.1~~GHVH01002816.1.p1  ORF type:complete len:1964 (+),score=314.78 GHVH01002816.1:1510-7401(+)
MLRHVHLPIMHYGLIPSIELSVNHGTFTLLSKSLAFPGDEFRSAQKHASCLPMMSFLKRMSFSCLLTLLTDKSEIEQLFLQFDCDISSDNVGEEIIRTLCSLTLPASPMVLTHPTLKDLASESRKSNRKQKYVGHGLSPVSVGPCWHLPVHGLGLPLFIPILSKKNSLKQSAATRPDDVRALRGLVDILDELLVNIRFNSAYKLEIPAATPSDPCCPASLHVLWYEIEWLFDQIQRGCVGSNASDYPLALSSKKKRWKCILEDAASVFNTHTKGAVARWIDMGLLHPYSMEDRVEGREYSPEGASALDVARLLRLLPDLSPRFIGEYLSKSSRWSKSVLMCHASTFDYRGLDLISAMRKYIDSFIIPGEGQCIDRVLDAFSFTWFTQQPIVETDTEFVVPARRGPEHRSYNKCSQAEKESLDLERRLRFTPRWAVLPGASIVEEVRFDHNEWYIDKDVISRAVQTPKRLHDVVRPSHDVLEAPPLRLTADFLREELGVRVDCDGTGPGYFQFTSNEIGTPADLLRRNLNPWASGSLPALTVVNSADAAHVLSFSIMMLQTDLHNPAVTNKMDVVGYLNQTTMIDSLLHIDGEPQPPGQDRDIIPAYRVFIYRNILTEEFKLCDTSVDANGRVDRAPIMSLAVSSVWTATDDISLNCSPRSESPSQPSCVGSAGAFLIHDLIAGTILSGGHVIDLITAVILTAVDASVLSVAFKAMELTCQIACQADWQGDVVDGAVERMLSFVDPSMGMKARMALKSFHNLCHDATASLSRVLADRGWSSILRTVMCLSSHGLIPFDTLSNFPPIPFEFFEKEHKSGPTFIESISPIPIFCTSAFGLWRKRSREELLGDSEAADPSSSGPSSYMQGFFELFAGGASISASKLTELQDRRTSNMAQDGGILLAALDCIDKGSALDPRQVAVMSSLVSSLMLSVGADPLFVADKKDVTRLVLKHSVVKMIRELVTLSAIFQNGKTEQESITSLRQGKGVIYGSWKASGGFDGVEEQVGVFGQDGGRDYYVNSNGIITLKNSDPDSSSPFRLLHRSLYALEENRRTLDTKNYVELYRDVDTLSSSPAFLFDEQVSAQMLIEQYSLVKGFVPIVLRLMLGASNSVESILSSYLFLPLGPLGAVWLSSATSALSSEDCSDKTYPTLQGIHVPEECERYLWRPQEAPSRPANLLTVSFTPDSSVLIPLNGAPFIQHPAGHPTYDVGQIACSSNVGLNDPEGMTKYIIFGAISIICGFVCGSLTAPKEAEEEPRLEDPYLVRYGAVVLDYLSRWNHHYLSTEHQLSDIPEVGSVARSRGGCLSDENPLKGPSEFTEWLIRSLSRPASLPLAGHTQLLMLKCIYFCARTLYRRADPDQAKQSMCEHLLRLFSGQPRGIILVHEPVLLADLNMMLSVTTGAHGAHASVVRGVTVADVRLLSLIRSLIAATKQADIIPFRKNIEAATFKNYKHQILGLLQIIKGRTSMTCAEYHVSAITIEMLGALSCLPFSIEDTPFSVVYLKVLVSAIEYIAENVTSILQTVDPDNPHQDLPLVRHVDLLCMTLGTINVIYKKFMISGTSNQNVDYHHSFCNNCVYGINQAILSLNCVRKTLFSHQLVSVVESLACQVRSRKAFLSFLTSSYNQSDRSHRPDETMPNPGAMLGIALVHPFARQCSESWSTEAFRGLSQHSRSPSVPDGLYFALNSLTAIEMTSYEVLRRQNSLQSIMCRTMISQLDSIDQLSSSIPLPSAVEEFTCASVSLIMSYISIIHTLLESVNASKEDYKEEDEDWSNILITTVEQIKNLISITVTSPLISGEMHDDPRAVQPDEEEAISPPVDGLPQESVDEYLSALFSLSGVLQATRVATDVALLEEIHFGSLSYELFDPYFPDGIGDLPSLKGAVILKMSEGGWGRDSSFMSTLLGNKDEVEVKTILAGLQERCSHTQVCFLYLTWRIGIVHDSQTIIEWILKKVLDTVLNRIR